MTPSAPAPLPEFWTTKARPSAPDPLVEMLEDEDLTDSARGFAAVALGIVAERGDLPWNAKFSRDINYRANTTTLTGQNATGLLDIL